MKPLSQLVRPNILALQPYSTPEQAQNPDTCV